MIWDLSNYQIFAHRGYLGDNTLESFQLCADKGFFVETDCVRTKTTFFMTHDRSVIFNGVPTNVDKLTDAEFLSVNPNAITLTEFLDWLKGYPEMGVMCDFYTYPDESIAQVAASGTIGQWMANVHDPNYAKFVEKYPELSYCLTQMVAKESELDWLRTPYNIVTSFVSGIDAKPNPEILTAGGYVDMTPENVDQWVATGATWFQPKWGGENLDKVKAALEPYRRPGYPNNVLIRMCAEAVKAKNQITGKIPGRNLPSEIRKIKTGSSDDTLDIKNNRNGNITNGLELTGLQKLKTINFRCNPKGNQSLYGLFLPDSSDVVLNVLDLNPGVSGGDKFRQIEVTEINFIPPVYPTDVWRYLYQWGGLKKVTGIGLDNITGFSGGDRGMTVDIDWVGELKNDADFSEFVGMTAYSVQGIVSKLADYSAGATHTLTIGPTYLAMLTPDEIAAAKAKNWTIT